MSPPRVIIAPDAFKGSLSAIEVARAMAAGIHDVDPLVTPAVTPLADGGEGTLEAFAAASTATLGAPHLQSVPVVGPLGGGLDAEWLHFPESGVGLVEMARASGLELVPEAKRDPLVTTTYGTGQLVLDAVLHGVTRLLVTIGGSATVDGGTGMARALGYRFVNDGGEELEEGGGALATLARIEMDGLSGAARDFLDGSGPTVVGLVDVDNPLTGPEGAAAVYGPQKGADPAAVVQLDRGLARLAEVASRDLGTDAGSVAGRAGAGAAGGLGAGLVWFLGADLRPGADAILDAMDFDGMLAGADLVITGEGRVDGQTARGKVVAAVARRARTHQVPVWVLAGTRGEGWEAVIEDCGVERVETIARPGDRKDEAEAVREAAIRLRRLAGALWNTRSPDRANESEMTDGSR